MSSSESSQVNAAGPTLRRLGTARKTNSTISRSIAWLSPRLDAVVGLALISAAALSAGLAHGLVTVPLLTVDDSWLLDLAFKAKGGIWLGRDVAFTYGPIFQWLLWTSLPRHSFSFGWFFRFAHLPLFTYSVIVVFLTARLLLPHCPAWKRALFILAVLVPWTYFEVRHVTALLLFALALCLFSSIPASTSKQATSALLLSAVLAGSFLLSVDTGIYGMAALIIVAGSYCFFCRSDGAMIRNILRFLVEVVLGFCVCAVLIGILFGEHYWIDAAALAANYRWSMAIPFTPPQVRWQLLFVLAAAGLIFFLAWKRRDPEAPNLAGRPVFFLSASVFSLLWVQSALVRSDWLHVSFGCFQAVALAGLALLGAPQRQSGWFSRWQVVLALVFVAVYINPSDRRPGAVASPFLFHARTLSACSDGTRFLDGICVQQDFFAHVQRVASFVRAQSALSDSIAVFPADNFYGLLAGRQVAGGVLQNYAAAGERLVHRQLDGLERSKPALAVYSSDSISGTVSHVSDLIRSPEVWLYLQSHYQTAAEIAPGILVLRRDGARGRRWSLVSSPLVAGEARHRFAAGAPARLEVASRVLWPADADLLRMRLRVDYPIWWSLTKPWQLSVSIGHADGSTKTVQALVPPSGDAEVWAYPWDESQLTAYFAPDPAQWRMTSRSPVTSVAVRFTPTAWFSIRPTAITVRGLDAVALQLRPSSPGLPIR